MVSVPGIAILHVRDLVSRIGREETIMGPYPSPTLPPLGMRAYLS